MSSSSSGGVDAKTKALDIISIVMASLSALSCFIVIALGLAIPRLRGFKSRLVIYLSVMDAGSAVAKLVGIASHGYQTPLCQAMGYFDETFSLMSVTWSSVIAITLFLMVVCGFVPYTRWWFKDWLMVLVVALCVFAFGIIPFFTLGYGSEGASWCWILGSNAFLFFYPILWVSFFVTLVMYCLVFRHLASKYKARHNKRVAGSFDAGGSLLTSETKETLLMLAPFPIVLCAVWTFPTIHRIYVILPFCFHFSDNY
ncbi:hypothetical protein Pelo_9648 [Pelomyxa schiedti]|nr:hypothetical protein Pelo_9648 [Pelomyxa schiedti]